MSQLLSNIFWLFKLMHLYELYVRASKEMVKLRLCAIKLLIIAKITGMLSPTIYI
jgi:hypothetical protein